MGWLRPAQFKENDMQVEVEILVQTITQMYGVLSQGDILRTSAEFAKHLVVDCAAAKYVGAAPASSTATAPVGEPEEGGAPRLLTIAELRDALTSKSIAFDPTAKKADLQSLLDAAQ